MKKIFLIRHCEAQGQSPEASLTEKGYRQAIDLSEFLSKVKIDRIISSPYKRAIDSIQPYASKYNIEVEMDRRLSERILSTENLPDWYEKLRATFDDVELKFEGGESSKEAMNRIISVVEDVLSSNTENTIIVSHGNLLSLLLKHFNKNFSFEDWQSLTNPDVYLLKSESNEVSYERLWKSGGRVESQ